jgi:hypothetical protein
MLIWLAHHPAMALCGVALTGEGYSLIYSGFGVEAIRRAPSTIKARPGTPRPRD